MGSPGRVDWRIVLTSIMIFARNKKKKQIAEVLLDVLLKTFFAGEEKGKREKVMGVVGMDQPQRR